MTDEVAADLMEALFLAHRADGPVDPHRTLGDLVVASGRCPLGNEGVQTDGNGLEFPGIHQEIPPEVVAMILGELDIPTLQKYRRACRSALTMINNFHKYRHIREHAPVILRAAVAVKASVSCYKVYLALTDTRCVSCGRFGGLLYIITGDRGPFTSKVDNMPFIRPLTGRYGIDPHLSADIPMLVDNMALRKTLSEDGEDVWPEHIHQELVRRPSHITPFQKERYMAVLPALCIGNQPQDEKVGWFCTACEIETGAVKHWRIQRTEAELIDHIEQQHGASYEDLDRVLDGNQTKSPGPGPGSVSPNGPSSGGADEEDVEESLGSTAMGSGDYETDSPSHVVTESLGSTSMDESSD